MIYCSIFCDDPHVGCCSSGMIDLKELSLISGKAAWMVYLVIVFAILPFSSAWVLARILNKSTMVFTCMY